VKWSGGGVWLLGVGGGGGGLGGGVKQTMWGSRGEHGDREQGGGY